MRTIIYNSRIIWISFILFLMTCPVIGQVKKTRQLTQADYHLWSTLKAESISDQGTWVSYSLMYESGLDTLFIKNTNNEKTVAFAKGRDGKFIGDTSWFGCITADNLFQVINLKTDKIQYTENVEAFSFSNNGKYIILHCNEAEGKTKIVIRNLDGNIIENIDNVTSYSMNPKGNILGYCTSQSNKNTVDLLKFEKEITKTPVVQNRKRQYENIIWQAEGNSIAFVSRLVMAKPFTADIVLFYKIEDKQLFQYDTTIEKVWKKDMILDANYTSALGISDDGERVFFRIKKKPNQNQFRNDLDVQVWNATDKELFASRDNYGSTQDNPRLVCWRPENNNFSEIENDEHSVAILGGTQQFALVYNPDTNKPTFKQEADKDYYLLDFKTGAKTVFLHQQPGTFGKLYFSPSGKYILYFKEGNWWIYSISTGIHTNMTLDTPVSFYDDSNDEPEEPNPYGYIGFTANDESVLLYDQFDIWQFKSNGTLAKKLTFGREKKQIFRLADTDKGNIDHVIFKGKVIDIYSDLILKAQAIDNSKSGYFNLDNKQHLQSIIYEPKLISSIFKAKISNSYMYVQEDYNESPVLIIKKRNAPAKVVHKSNAQHDYYSWGKSELIEYKNSKGAILKGVLFYPFDYDPGRQYPMIVNIYQKQTKALHTYVNPSLLNGSAFNVTYYTSHDYFVLLPDIIYEIGSPGLSAADCVISATHSVIETASIDKAKIGLIGHSFGAYEAFFIITQTNLFAAAVAGSGISDLTSGYLSVNWGYKNMNSWRYEYQQFRMKKTLFEDFQGYRKNSPIFFASNVNTPLLSYTGAEDTTVNPAQTMEFYLALRRLKKEHIMLLYPKENHTIQGRANQIDLTHKISEWFGYYLKGEKKPDWFEAH
ncbi:S9 family peptidase [Flavobacterium sp. IB48]|uniref:alpha/beta hydrolase family protein n=1 Tax=Flavobacterium sp. IB48 TaxID=2779375 RepID=UPI0018E788CF|nr:prolyl oligopeptidase family serine peptidase [Flavobacterium sp. IB48]MBJ2126357.1 S9 family peptidase [Flavobacterium sp. IB48]